MQPDAGRPAAAAAGRYTAAQAAAGRTTYQAQCASCHLPDLKGSGDAAPLAGSEFMDAWGRRTTRELLSFMQLTMPPTRPGALSQEEYVNIAAFILQSNGARGRQSGADAERSTSRSTRRDGAGAGGGRGAAGGTRRAAGGRASRRRRTRRGAAGPPAGITVDGEVKNFVPVTDAMLRNPDPADWLMIRRDYHASNYSPLNQITARQREGSAPAVGLGDERRRREPARADRPQRRHLPQQPGQRHAGDRRQDRRADLGEPLRHATPTAPRCAASRIYDDKLFVATSDAHLMAFDARTGKTVWDTTIGDRSKGNYSTSSGPLVAKGKVIQGLGGCQTYREEKCFISAYDAATGKQLWRFNTIAQRRASPAATRWGTLPNLFRAGGESWITGSYDPVLNLTYWGTAQAKPWMPISRGMSVNDDALYTSSTLALDVDTGKLAWYYQHAPGESLDLDVVFERVLVDDDDQNLLFTVGKDGVLWKLDRKTGKYLGHKETVFQNVWERFDPQDRPAARTAPTSSSSSSATGCRAARAPKAATTGRRRAITRARTS